MFFIVFIQADEIEALSAIYGDQFHNEDDIEKKFSIEITDGKNIPHYVLSLQVCITAFTALCLFLFYNFF